ncbi:hypothetical protein O3G_MSEX002749 [Manduca sexta]|uniref:Major facilitator superfamily (MFS) profile domain-containing protein n=1 Tax=Manduca sexta TaxID=7130 RepID=A0A921YPW8_MANSE|nr:hypothetical protein O3G_MSEX002749 [Manduca sexta]
MSCARIPSRYAVATMIFISSCASYMMRTNLNVNLVAMVPVSNTTEYDSQVTLNWTAYERANVMSSHLWGDILACLIGGPIAERWGARYVVITGVLISAMLTMVTPVAAKQSYIAMLIVRLLLGFFSGFVNPGCHVLISRWAVATDKGKFSGALMGGSIGIFLAWTICGFLIGPFGWEWGFYFFGIVSFVLGAMLCWSMYDSPDTHPRISKQERKYLAENITVQNGKLSIPYRHILTSLPFWSLCIINFGSGWGIFFVITAAPNYIANALNFNIASTGVLSALTYLAKSIFAMIFGSIGDFLLKKKCVTLNALRKCAIFISHVLPGLGLLGMGYPGMNPAYYITLITAVMALNGSVTLTTAVNGHDLTRNFAGTVNGIAFAMMPIAGIITPYITAYFTKSDETSAALWQPVFYTGGSVFIATGLQFLIFGSTETQPWNVITKIEDEKDKEKEKQ